MNQNETRTRKLGRYELKEEIGRGGMAVVYRAFDTTLRRDVAIKLLHSHLVSHQEARNRFEREAHSVARLKHPAIVAVHDYSETDEGEVFLVMELVDGITLRQFLESRQGRPLLAETAALIAREVFLALQAAHDEGIVHRDVKPENILISEKGEVRLSDFGIAFLAGIGQMTMTGQILGSPTYMSPEHIERTVVDARADIFSVGILLYEMSVGTLPFTGSNPHQIIKRVVEGYYDQPLSANPAVGHAVSSVIVRCLQQQPDRRYASALEAANELDRLLTEMGMSTSAETLREFFDNPDVFEADLIQRLIPRTVELGRLARRGRRLPEAMNHFNRVLSLDPRNITALEAVNTLSRRRQFKRGLERFGVVAGFALIVLGLALLIVTGNLPGLNENSQPASTPTIPRPPKAPIETPPTTTAAVKTTVPSSALSPDSATRGKAAPSTDTDTRNRGPKRPTEPPTTETRTVVFNPVPMSVEIAFEDGERFIYKTSDRSRSLPLGIHRITFIPRDDRLLPLTSEITVKPGEGPMSVGARLRWKPGRLLVRSNVKAEVSVDGRALGMTNEPFDISFENSPLREALILISGAGYRPVSRQVSLAAAKTTEVVVHLENQQN